MTTLGCVVGRHYVVQPDGRVARCFKVYGSDVPVLWQSVADWKYAAWHRKTTRHAASPN